MRLGVVWHPTTQRWAVAAAATVGRSSLLHCHLLMPMLRSTGEGGEFTLCLPLAV